MLSETLQWLGYGFDLFFDVISAQEVLPHYWECNVFFIDLPASSFVSHSYCFAHSEKW